eukprot:s5041_g1.t3
MSVAAIAVMQYGALAWCYVLLRKEGASSSSLIAAGVVARGLAMVLAPVAGYLADVKGVAWLQFLGALILAIAGIPNFLAMQSNAQSDEAVVVFYGVGYGIILAFTGMVYFLYVVELFPVEIRNVGVGMSYNIGFCIFGGFAPLICEASHDVASWAPGCVLSVAGVITASTVLFSLRLQSRGVLCLAHIRADPYFEASSCNAKVTRKDFAKDQSVKGGEGDAQATEQAKCKKGELTEMTEENFQTVRKVKDLLRRRNRSEVSYDRALPQLGVPSPERELKPTRGWKERPARKAAERVDYVGLRGRLRARSRGGG